MKGEKRKCCQKNKDSQYPGGQRLGDRIADDPLALVAMAANF